MIITIGAAKTGPLKMLSGALTWSGGRFVSTKIFSLLGPGRLLPNGRKWANSIAVRGGPAVENAEMSPNFDNKLTCLKCLPRRSTIDCDATGWSKPVRALGPACSQRVGLLDLLRLRNRERTIGVLTRANRRDAPPELRSFAPLGGRGRPPLRGRWCGLRRPGRPFDFVQGRLPSGWASEARLICGAKLLDAKPKLLETTRRQLPRNCAVGGAPGETLPG
jgi:hypothetical protein